MVGNSLRNSTIFASAIFSAEERNKFTVRYFGNRFGTVRQTLRLNTVVTTDTHARTIEQNCAYSDDGQIAIFEQYLQEEYLSRH